MKKEINMIYSKKNMRENFVVGKRKFDKMFKKIF